MMTYIHMVFIKALRDPMDFMWYFIDDKCHTIKMNACLSLAYIAQNVKWKTLHYTNQIHVSTCKWLRWASKEKDQHL